MPPAPVPRLLAHAFKASRALLQRRLDAHGVHAGQDYLLDALWEQDGLTVGALAERLHVEVPTVVKTVDRMEVAGLVRREADPADRRRSRIRLTDRGRAVVPAVRAALGEVEEIATAGFSDAERQTFRELLERARANLREEPDQ
jgi:MarR family transcriptional regulator, organic hydroperoxide resistance regulator